MEAKDLAKRLAEIRKQLMSLLHDVGPAQYPRVYGHIAVTAQRMLDAELGCSGVWPRPRGVVAIWSTDAQSVARDVRDLLDDEAMLLADMTQLFAGLSSDQLALLSNVADESGMFDMAKKGAA